MTAEEARNLRDANRGNPTKDLDVIAYSDLCKQIKDSAKQGGTTIHYPVSKIINGADYNKLVAKLKENGYEIHEQLTDNCVTDLWIIW